jgi:hypothetical protein
MVVITGDSVFVFEFKLAKDATETDKLLKAALDQIDSRGYLIPYSAGNRKLVKVGAVFSAATRTLEAWEVRG